MMIKMMKNHLHSNVLKRIRSSYLCFHLKNIYGIVFPSLISRLQECYVYRTIIFFSVKKIFDLSTMLNSNVYLTALYILILQFIEKMQPNKLSVANMLYRAKDTTS